MSRPRPRGRLRGLAGGVCPGQHPGVGGVQAHTRGIQAQALGVCIPGCTEADTPQQTATAVDGTHPTRMHSCLGFFVK